MRTAVCWKPVRSLRSRVKVGELDCPLGGFDFRAIGV
jgi:hypothetical protein